jgi:mRNA interferase MazF
MAPPRKVTPRRGDVYLVDFEPTRGAEIRKTRPGVIIQNDISNRWSPVTIVAAITSHFDAELYPTEVLIRRGEGGLQTDSVALLNQIRSIDKARLVRLLGKISAETMKGIDRALVLSLGLVRL